MNSDPAPRRNRPFREDDQYKGVGRALLGKVRDPKTGKNVPIAQFTDNPEGMIERIVLGLDQNREKIQRSFGVAQERINQSIPLLKLAALKRGLKDPDGELVQQIVDTTNEQTSKLYSGYAGPIICALCRI